LKLKELELFGFKSFADKTRLEFGEGITIIVGPNGSGKSNIMDSIRWVLGEQSAKSLRGGKMEDVIFIGSDSRKTLGMAEVSMVMDNTDKAINLPYTEVKVARRLYRSGESEYFINDNPCRLKDILELFMDTGVGIDSYSIISQGEVERIINAKPLERREIFEEAAGITKYIKKRDEALRKLETTEQHMLRINDILAEVKRQESALERQAKRAEKYKELKQECGDMEIKMHKKDIKDKSVEYRKFNSENDAYNKRIEEEDAKLSAHEGKYAEMERAAAEMERGMAEKKEKWLIAEQEIKRLQDSFKFLTDRQAELESRVTLLKSENVESVGKMEALKLEVSEKEKILQERLVYAGTKEKELDAQSMDADAAMAEYEAKKRERDEKTGFFEKFSEELNALKNRMAAQEMAIVNMDEKIAAGALEKKEIEDRIARVGLELEKISEGRVLKEGEIQHVKEKEEKLIKEKMRKKAELEALDNMLKELGLVVSRLETRFNFLKKMHEQLEGYGETVRKVLTEYRMQLEDDKRGDIVGAAGNLLTVEKNYETAVEKAFRDQLQSVLVKDSTLVEEIFSMYEKEKGGINLVSLKDAKVDPAAVLDKWRKMAARKDIIAYLPSVITPSGGNEILKLMFYNVFVVADLRSAAAVLADMKTDEKYYLLALNGELVSNYGTFKKGESEADTGTGFLSREREIGEIGSEIQNARQKYEAVSAEKDGQAQRISDMERSIEELSVIYHSQYVEVIKDDERIKQRQEERGALLKAAEKAVREKQELEGSRGDMTAAAEALLIEKTKMEEELDKLKQESDALRQDLYTREEELNRRKNSLENLRIEIVKIKGDYEFEANNRLVLRNKISEIEARYGGTIREIEDLNQKTAQAEDEKKSNEAKIDGHRGVLATAETELNLKKEEYAQFKSGMEKLGVEIKELGRERDRLKEEQYNIRLKINEISLQVKAIYEKIQQEYKLSLSEDEIMAAEINEDEYRELSMKVSEFREKIDKLGVINLVAIEEYNELKKRNEFLQAQYDDLIQARENLNKVIKKTNEESKELFNRAFVEIKARFAEVFKKMMNGGEADLLLTDNENTLLAGVDIIARPPGKRLQNITLLSGGEKSITAVSLLFALFLIKASPFCIMDEVDAALDDINVARFTNLIKSFRRTQFLIISHNKLTMETADVIYGVSMEKAGVSQIMSVKLDKWNGAKPVEAGGDGK
jgi:chromosome segregation protein